MVSMKAEVPRIFSGFFGITTSRPAASVTVYPVLPSPDAVFVPQPDRKTASPQNSAAARSFPFMFLSPSANSFPDSVFLFREKSSLL